MKKTELLAPAGDLEILKSVALSGADAVYFGGELFGARKNAKNFTLNEAEEALRFLHLHNKKGYLTVNTLLKNTEIERDLYKYLKSYYEIGLDAVIVQDFGVMTFVRDYFPAMHVHASTQMSGASKYSARLFKEQGCTRLVTARELSISEIKEIHDNVDIEIETFVHGALCVSYSGNCLMSSMIGGRSGNRGLCAQPCRLPYDVLDEDKKPVKNAPGKYMLSPKDLCGLRDIKKMSEAGVFSFKIEGRMKSISYASGVTAVYREAFDRTEAGEDMADPSVSKKLYEKLLNLGNREGFTDLYFLAKNGKEMMSFRDSAHKAFDHLIRHAYGATPSPQGEGYIPISGVLSASGSELKLTVSNEDVSVTVTGEKPDEAINRATTKEEIRETLCKTGNTQFSFEELEVFVSDGLFIPMKNIKSIRRDAFEKLTKELLPHGDRPDPVPYEEYGIDTDEIKTYGINERKPSVSAHVLSKEQLEAVLKHPSVGTVGVPASLCIKDKYIVNRIANADKRSRILLPPVFRTYTEQIFFENKDILNSFDEYMPYTYDGLKYLLDNNVDPEKIILSDNLYTWNERSIIAFGKLGIYRFTAPFELNEKELAHRNNENTEFMIYGRYPLMYMQNCINRDMFSCNKTEKTYFLKDRLNMVFPVYNTCTFCYNTLYNSLPTSLINEAEKINRLGFSSIRYSFTTESKKETEAILSGAGPKEKATNGHFKRGVQ